MNSTNLHLFYQPKERLRVTVGEEKTVLTVKPAWAAPLSHPGKYLVLLDGKGDEIVMISDPAKLPKADWELLQNELYQRYLTATISAILHAKQEYGATYWTVETNRGPRDFVTQSLQENALWYTDTHLLLIDVDGNRFEIPDTTALDAHSRSYIEAIL